MKQSEEKCIDEAIARLLALVPKIVRLKELISIDAVIDLLKHTKTINEGFFDIIFVHRDDLDCADYDSSNISDNTMYEIAEHMAESFRSDDFNNALDDAASANNIPKKERYDTSGG